MHRKVTLPFVRFTAQARATNWNGEIAGVASDTSGESGTVMWKPIARRRCWRLFDLQCFGVGQPRAHKRGRMLSETVTMRAVCLALALGWVLACSDLAAPPLLLDLDGRYVGSWQVIARDTAEVDFRTEQLRQADTSLSQQAARDQAEIDYRSEQIRVQDDTLSLQESTSDK